MKSDGAPAFWEIRTGSHDRPQQSRIIEIMKAENDQIVIGTSDDRSVQGHFSSKEPSRNSMIRLRLLDSQGFWLQMIGSVTARASTPLNHWKAPPKIEIFGCGRTIRLISQKAL
jgi:hypothetical protein